MNVATHLRDALRSLPNLAMASSGHPPALEDIFFPESHAEVLDPEVSLVIGNRGMGKTFWSLALEDKNLRPEITRRYLGTRPLHLNNFDVSFGFSDAEGSRGAISRALLESVPRRTSVEIIWRAVVLRALAPKIGHELPRSFRELVTWVRTNPEDQIALFRRVDEELSQNGDRVLLLFDQLDQLATDWNRIQELTQGLLKTALAMKSYRSIKLKLFMRPDQAESRQLFQFPDASKISGGSRRLTWRTSDLYGLLFFEIMRLDEGQHAFAEVCNRIGINAEKLHPRLSIPTDLVGNSIYQGLAFDEIAGPVMGRGSKRGRPFTWIPTHLADARGEIAPRTFLQVIKTAAEWDYATTTATPIDFQGIQEGVRRASSTRLAELEEDYPWVSLALEPLRGLLVPCPASDITSRWSEAKTVQRIDSEYSGSSAPIDLVFVNLFGEEKEAAPILVKLMREIGVFEERDRDRVNVPDIFRVNAGILRKGGVTPQQRRRLA